MSILDDFRTTLINIRDNSKEDFSGIGIIVYDSKLFQNDTVWNMRPSFKLNNKISITNKDFVDLMLSISKMSNPLHDGFHLINEIGELTHIAQVFLPKINLNINPHESYGSRFNTAILGSYMAGIICIGIINSDHSAHLIFNGGVEDL